MKKMKTLFKRQFENHKIAKCLNEVEPECQWVLDGEGWATEKIDGTCCLIKDGQIYQKELENGTYELIGPHINANPYNLKEDILVKHGSTILENVPREYEGIKQYLKEHYIEGIVFYRGNGEMCKIKRSDFNFEWNKKYPRCKI